jgi:hypothetical protein
MSGIVADTLVRIYDTNLAKLDGLALKTWLVTFWDKSAASFCHQWHVI